MKSRQIRKDNRAGPEQKLIKISPDMRDGLLIVRKRTRFGCRTINSLIHRNASMCPISNGEKNFQDFNTEIT